MITEVALLRQDGSGTIALEGTIRFQSAHSGRVTEHPIPSRTVIADHVVQLPTRISISAIVSPRRYGPQRLAEVRGFLTTCQQSAALLDIQRPGGDLLTDFVVERWRDVTENTDAFTLDLELRSVLLAEAVRAEVRRASNTPPNVIGAVHDPVDTGQGGTEVVNEDLANRLQGFAVRLGQVDDQPVSTLGSLFPGS